MGPKHWFHDVPEHFTQGLTQAWHWFEPFKNFPSAQVEQSEGVPPEQVKQEESQLVHVVSEALY